MRYLNGFIIISLFLVALGILSPQTYARAQNESENLVKIRLVPEMGKIEAGQEIWVAIEQQIQPHWHTYWKNPGDSGSKPVIDWVLPEGFEASEIFWPTPKKLPYGPLLNYGYEDQVILLQKIKAPEILWDEQLEFSADVEILVCKEECIPEFGTYTMVLNGPDSEAEDNTAFIARAVEKLPRDAEFAAVYEVNGDDLRFEFKDVPNGGELTNIEFYPVDWGVVKNPAELKVEIADDAIVLTQDLGERPIKGLNAISGVFAYDLAGQRLSYEFTAQKKNGSSSVQAKNKDSAAKVAKNGFALENIGLLQAIIWAFIGGLILNIMPCVFPVLSMKALSLVKISDKSKGLAQAHGLAYTGGVVFSFVGLAAVLIVFNAGGWGFHLQNSNVIIALSYLMFVIGLNLIGLFDINVNAGNVGQGLTQTKGLTGTFFTGVLATIVATPCTAPFMAGAIGFALVQPPIVALSVFAMLGLGLAFPYLVLSFVPALRKFLPKPGAWMETFRQFLAFPMFGFTVWLLWILSAQAEPIVLVKTLVGMVFVAFGLWLLKHLPKQDIAKEVLHLLAILSLFVSVGIFFMGNTKDEFSESYSPEILQQALKSKDPVFVEMTATWCITCKINHSLAMNVVSTKRLFADQSVRYLIGDWTNYDEGITKYLKSYGRNGVPIYVFYGAPDGVSGQRPDPVLLPQILTPGIVADYVMGRAP